MPASLSRFLGWSTPVKLSRCASSELASKLSSKLRSRREVALLCLSLLLLSLGPMRSRAGAAEPPTRLLDQQPFDRVTLDASNRNETVDTLLLDLPNRQVPAPFPAAGALELRRLSEPSTLYTVSWESIAKIELFEQLLLAESVKLAESRDLEQAYEYLQFLYQNYPQLAGLQLATEQYLRQDALSAYRDKDYETALTVLLSIYDLNPQHQGLKNFVVTVTDRLIAAHLRARNYAAARSVLDLLSDGFSQLQAANVASWQTKFERAAARQLSLARAAIDQDQFLEARRATRRALAILPTVIGAEAMLEEIDRKSPLVMVGVDQLRGSQRFFKQLAQQEMDWTNQRISKLTEPKFLELVGFGAEGGNYASRWATLAGDDTGLKFDLNLNGASLREGFSAEVIALELLRLSDPTGPLFRADFAELLKSVEIRQGNRVSIHLRRSHVRPEALLPLTLKNFTDSAVAPGAYQSSVETDPEESITYVLPKTLSPETESTTSKTLLRGPQTISEQFYDNEEQALADLLSGELDILARVPPWQIDRLQATDGIVVTPYRLPTIHVLLPNYEKSIMGRREFRRALCYGIDRPQILNDILLGGENRAGYRVLSGPLPAGITLTDPVGYAYNQGLQPRSYEPRLAAVLASVARQAITGKAPTPSAAVPAPPADQAETASDPQPVAKPVDPLILAHPPNPVATAACQSIKLQLDAVGIRVELKPLGALGTESSAEDDPSSEFDWDLYYAELALWEPIVDARRLLGPHGLAGNCSSSMSLALQDVDQANNWKQARSRLHEVHQTAFYDLPVIPLWQTLEHFAHRQSLHGIGTNPVTLYQNVEHWKRVSLGNRQGAGR